MLAAIRSKLTYANVVSTLCLFLVMGGGTAVALSGHNTVFSDDIVNKQVKRADVGTNAVDTTKVVDNSLTGDDVNESTFGMVPTAANSALVNGKDYLEFVNRGSADTSKTQSLQWLAYFMDTSGAHDYDFGGIVRIHTTGTAGEFEVCNNQGGATYYVAYVNGVRSTGFLGTNVCSSAYDPGLGGDFHVSMRRNIIFGTDSGDGTENYELIGFTSL